MIGPSASRLAPIRRAGASTRRRIIGSLRLLCRPSPGAGEGTMRHFVIVSSRFSIMLATVVYAASSVDVELLVARRLAGREQLLRGVGLRLEVAPGDGRSVSRSTFSSSGCRPRAVASLKRVGDPLVGRRAAFVHHPLGELPRGLDVRRVVHQHQRLQRRVRRGRRTVQNSRSGASNDVQRRRRGGALPERVQAPAVQVFAVCLACRPCRYSSRRRRRLPTAPPAGTASRSARRPC